MKGKKDKIKIADCRPVCVYIWTKRYNTAWSGQKERGRSARGRSLHKSPEE